MTNRTLQDRNVKFEREYAELTAGEKGCKGQEKEEYEEQQGLRSFFTNLIMEMRAAIHQYS
jgi:hypothetical protein